MNPKKKKSSQRKRLQLANKAKAAAAVAAFAALRARDQVRAVALLAGAREVLRAFLKLQPAVPLPKGLERAAVPLELVQAAGDLLIPLNEFLNEAQR